MDIVERLETTNVVVGWAFALQHGVSYLVGPLASLLLRIFTKRQVSVLGGCLVGTCYIYCGLCLKSVWQLFSAYTISGIGLGLHMFAGYLNFYDHLHDNMGTAVSVASLFNFVGISTVPLILQYLKESFGLNNALVLFGALMLNLVVSAFAVSVPVRKPRCVQSDNSKELDEEESCPFFQDQTVDDTDKSRNEKSNLNSCFQAWYAMFKHENLAIVMTLEGLMLYIFVSRGLFLVSVGKSAGFDSDQAVLLSSSGGFGGVLGKLIAVALFRTERMGALTGTFIPLLCNAVCLVGCAVTRCYYMMLFLTFVNGTCIGVNSSGLFGLLPTLVCRYHFHQAFVTSSFLDGITMQLAGFISGLITDITGSARYVFVFNALLSVAGLPLASKWACNHAVLANACTPK